ncbi:MAG: hypothetical protein GX422_03350 [Deltaproteobacteria bacterium]|nr:hypothetical protein [Deltaproteobacteria bacterium]
MIQKKPLLPERVRRIEGSFAFIEHRFLHAGFWRSLRPQERLLYVLLVLASDRHGLSYYSYDKLCSLLVITADDYIEARDGLIEQDLLAFDGTLFQVLSLPNEPIGRAVVAQGSHRGSWRWP